MAENCHLPDHGKPASQPRGSSITAVSSSMSNRSMKTWAEGSRLKDPSMSWQRGSLS